MFTSAPITAFQFGESVRRHVRYTLGKEWNDTNPTHRLIAVSHAVRELIVDVMLDTERRVCAADAKRVYYLSIEFLVGRSLVNSLRNLGVYEVVDRELRRMGLDLSELLEQEPDAALGNGGLGRLAACMLDSMASLGMPGYGYGINYEHGLFRQEIAGRQQIERPDTWRSSGSPWLIPRAEKSCAVPVYGHVVDTRDERGEYHPIWSGWRLILGMPHDMPIIGYSGHTANFLRLYSAHSSTEFDMRIFNEGDYIRAVQRKISDETITKVLYPADTTDKGRELRLLQEYFFVACAIRDILRRYDEQHHDITGLSTKVAIQLNDTHPALAIAELMRQLVDDRDLGWDAAWEITQATFSYTNHTLLPEALETWTAELMGKVVPRHLHIIYEINRRLLDHVRATWPGMPDLAGKVAIVDGDRNPRIRMANLAIVGSHVTNGVAQIHSRLLRETLVPDFAMMWPERFQNKTNGVTPRRWLHSANPGLSDLLSRTIGKEWVTDLDRLEALAPHADDGAFLGEFAHVKATTKQRLAAHVRSSIGQVLDTTSMFDVQIKRIHEYKRQLLNILQVMDSYLGIVEDRQDPVVPRTCIFAGKAAPGYWQAKQVIRLILHVARVVNSDPRANGRLRVVFLPDYRVTLAERIIPAADLSEQISMAGTEASGTGNMKLALNGAVTIGTLDGANIEIRDAVGPDNMFAFGLTAEQVSERKAAGTHRPQELLARDARLRRVVESLISRLWNPRGASEFRSLYDALTVHGDSYFVLADFASYAEAHQHADQAYADPARWNRMAVLNVAAMGRFSSDRTVREYARDIWGIDRLG